MADENIPRAEKDPADWTTGDEPMTGPQKSYLQMLAQEAGDPAPGDDLSKERRGVEADRRAAGPHRPGSVDIR